MWVLAGIVSGTHCSGMQCGVSVPLWRSVLVGQNGTLTQPLHVSRCFEGHSAMVCGV